MWISTYLLRPQRNLHSGGAATVPRQAESVGTMLVWCGTPMPDIGQSPLHSLCLHVPTSRSLGGIGIVVSETCCGSAE